jgi:glycyl-tRNA synthetase (class II)
MKATLLKHYDFIWAVSRDLIRPDSSNIKVKEILKAYHEIDTTVDVLVECSTCVNVYKDAFKLILDYIDAPIVEVSEPIVNVKKTKK